MEEEHDQEAVLPCPYPVTEAHLVAILLRLKRATRRLVVRSFYPSLIPTSSGPFSQQLTVSFLGLLGLIAQQIAEMELGIEW